MSTPLLSGVPLADLLIYLVCFSLGVLVSGGVGYLYLNRRISQVTTDLNIEKNSQFKVAITSSHEDIVKVKEQHSRLLNEAAESGDKSSEGEHRRQYIFYTQVYSYSLALQKHRWSRSPAEVN